MNRSFHSDVHAVYGPYTDRIVPLFIKCLGDCFPLFLTLEHLKIKKKILFQDSKAHGEGENKEQDKDLEIEKNQDEASSQASTSQQKQAAAVTPTKQPKTKDFKSPTTPKNKKRKLAANLASSTAPILHEGMDLMRSIQSRKVDRDEYLLFGEQVAMKLRRPSPRARFMVQHAINQALFDAEMGM